MLEIILLIMGISKAIRRPKLKKLVADDFPGVEPEKFSEWQQSELKATNTFLIATWGAFAIKIFLLMAFSGESFELNQWLAMNGTILVLWFIGLAIAGANGSKAKKLRITAGINWPNAQIDPMSQEVSERRLSVNDEKVCPHCDAKYHESDYSPDAGIKKCSSCKKDLP